MVIPPSMAGIYAARTWATMIWTVVLLLIFVTMREMSRVLGKAN